MAKHLSLTSRFFIWVFGDAALLPHRLRQWDRLQDAKLRAFSGMVSTMPTK
jgi:hypothetical protein